MLGMLFLMNEQNANALRFFCLYAPKHLLVAQCANKRQSLEARAYRCSRLKKLLKEKTIQWKDLN